MINKIILFSIKNKLIIGLFTIALIVGGVWSMTKVSLDAVPDITNNQVQVITRAPNLGTEDIEQFVTYPVEVAMANLPGVKGIRSVSRFGLSLVTIVFEDDMGTYLPRQLVGEKLIELKGKILKGFGEPSMGPISTGLGEIYQYTLEVDSLHQQLYSTTDLRTMQDWIVRRQMAMVPGVVEVNAFGGYIKQYEVAVDPDELKAVGLTISEIFTALEKNNQNTGGAYIEKDHYANFIRGEGLIRNLRDIENIVVTNVDGLPISIKDVAKVQFGRAVRYGAFTKDGKGEAVGGMILMLKGANSNNVIENVKNRIIEIQKSLPKGVTIQPFLDRNQLIAKTTSTVNENLVEGALIVIFVLVFLLGNWRGGLIVASTIPLSLFFAFVAMNIFDVWANLMSLGAIDFGIIVDGAVIIVEGTVFLFHKKILNKENVTTSKVRDSIVYTAASKMMNSAFFGQLIILIIFIPILALQGVEGKMFKPMALTFMFSMIGVMLLCLTYVPMMSAWLIRRNKKNRNSWGDRLVTWLENSYESILDKALKKARGVVISAFLLIGLAVVTFTGMGGEFIPQLDEGDVAFHVILKPGSSLSESIKTSTKIEQILLNEFPEIEEVMTRFGVADVPTDPMPMDIGDCFVLLKPKNEWVSANSKEELITKMKVAISTVPGINYEFTQPIEMRFNELLAGVREDIAVKLFGEELDILAVKAKEMAKIISTVRGVADMKVEAIDGLPQMTVNYNRHKLAQYGLHIEELNTIIQAAFSGGKAGIIFEGEKRFDLVVRLDAGHRKSIEDIKNLYINLPNNSQIPLKEVADISYQSGPMQISRDNTNRRTYVGINVRGRDIKSLVGEIREKIEAQLELPPGYYIRYGGEFENLERANKRLQVVVPIALGLIFLFIFFALNSFKQSLMIYIAIPLASIGGIFSLWLRDMPFSISAGVGFIVLFGVAVLNGLVLVSGWNELKQKGMSNLNERIRLGAKRRIRPILLTALTDVLGFLPMAISTSAGAEVQQPLATVVIGGMITATLLTLFVLPILYRWVESRTDKVRIGKNTIILLLISGAFFLSLPEVKAQIRSNLVPMTLEQSIEKAKSIYPKIRSAQLEVENQEALKKTAWNLGNINIFTAGEELNRNQGVHTIVGIGQQNIDILGIPANMNLQKKRIGLAEVMLNISELELEYQVKRSYGKLYATAKKYELYRELDSVFREFERATKIRYETEATSGLTYLAASNQSHQIAIEKNQMFHDYQIALRQFNLWMVSDTLFTVTSEENSFWDLPLSIDEDSVNSHPLLNMISQKVQIAQQEVQVAKAGFLPKFNFQYGVQEVDGQSGFYQYQVGMSIPLFFVKKKGIVQSAKIRKGIAEQNLHQSRLELQNNYQKTVENYLKWKTSWEYYKTKAMKLAKKQRKGSTIAYREGAIDYISFLQNVRGAMQIEIAAWLAFEQYLDSRFKMEYFINQ